MSFPYAPNQIRVTPSLTVQVGGSSAGAVNGVAVDLLQFQGPVLVSVHAPVASSGDTIAWTVEHSETGVGSWATIGADYLVDPDTGEPDTFTGVTDAVAVNEQLALKTENLRRYVRVVATLAGTTISAPLAAFVIGPKRTY